MRRNCCMTFTPGRDQSPRKGLIMRRSMHRNSSSLIRLVLGERSGRRAAFGSLSVVLFTWLFSWSSVVTAQTVRVDTTPSHVTNTFSPLYALGSTVDRVPSNATDVFFRPDQIKQVLSAGWGVISYRQKTDLFVQAWHWNPKGTSSDPPAHASLTAAPTPPNELIRHSYGYQLRHRGFTRNRRTQLDGFSRLDDGDLQTY